MLEGQIKSLEQSEILLESAKTNPYHKEIAKYLINNMNSVAWAIKKGWCEKAGEHDLEYMDKYIQLRDKYASVLYPDSLIGEKGYKDVQGEYHPRLDDSLIVEALKSYDFDNECGSMLFKSIESNYSRRCNEWHIKHDTAENVEFARNVHEQMQLMRK